jgi:hypothetical protein
MQVFNERSIACAPLTCPTFQADTRKVHQLIKSFLQSETAEQWIKALACCQSGQEDMQALQKHYTGKGNISRRITQAETLCNNLHYKQEKYLSFSTFLDRLQKMFNIFEEDKEPISEQAKVRMLLKKINHPQLQDAVGALRVCAQMDGITFTECANHLFAIVSELPDQTTPRKVSATNSKLKINCMRGGDAKLAAKMRGTHMPDDSIWTGYYSDWERMSDNEK